MDLNPLDSLQQQEKQPQLNIEAQGQPITLFFWFWEMLEQEIKPA